MDREFLVEGKHPSQFKIVKTAKAAAKYLNANWVVRELVPVSTQETPITFYKKEIV